MNHNNKPKPPILPPILGKKKYSISIYTAFKGKWSELPKSDQAKALKTQWYVRWYYRHPGTGKMTRQLNYYGHTNSFHTYKERISVLKALRASLENLLASGFNPYSVKNNDIDSKSNAFDAIDYAMGIKKNHMKHSSFVRFTSDINKFKDYLKANGYDVRFISSINKKTVTNYLNGVIPEVSTRSRNNYKTNIGSLWQILEDEGVIERNFIKSISMLKSKPNRNKTYTDAQVEELFRYMETNTPQLLLFVKFVSYGFLRPLEVCRLTHNSFNWKDSTLTVKTKQEESKTKTIPSILLKEIPKGGTGFLFTKDGYWGEWDISEDAKRGHFSREFRKVKDVFGLGEDFGVYSFRHAFVSKLYRSLRSEGLSPFEVKSKMLLITGHSTISALEKYLRSINAEISKDYSDLLG